MYGLIQIVVVAALVAFSAVQLLRKLLPQTARSAQARVARALGLRWLEPVSASPKGCGSGVFSDGGGCGGCKGCASIAALTEDLTRDLPKA